MMYPTAISATEYERMKKDAIEHHTQWMRQQQMTQQQNSLGAVGIALGLSGNLIGSGGSGSSSGQWATSSQPHTPMQQGHNPPSVGKISKGINQKLLLLEKIK